VAAALALGLVVVLAGCGGGGGGDDQGSSRRNAPVAPGAREVTVDARSFEFDPNEIDVRAGEDIAVRLHSEDQTHDFVIEARGKEPEQLVVEVQGGKTATGGFSIAQPGKYTFFCSLPGHRAAGMVGTITVS
jgi:cytochrome c oxidase subunit 2